jgi:hypothetical protein
MTGEIQLEPIPTFSTPGEFSRFEDYLAAALASGALKELPVDPDYHVGEIYGGRWFELVANGTVWRLIPPDPPFLGLFERVRQLKAMK